MKSKKIRLIKITLSTLLIIFIVGLIEWTRGIDQFKVNERINNYYSSKNGKVINAAYKLIGNRKHGMIVNQYIYLEEDIYINKDNNLELQSSQVIPVRVKLISFFGFYKILWCSSPPDGEFYGKVLEILFPKDILKKLDDNMAEYFKEISEKSDEQLETIKSNLNLK